MGEVGHHNGRVEGHRRRRAPVVRHLLSHDHLVDEGAADAADLGGNVDAKESLAAESLPGLPTKKEF